MSIRSLSSLMLSCAVFATACGQSNDSKPSSNLVAQEPTWRKVYSCDHDRLVIDEDTNDQQSIQIVARDAGFVAYSQLGRVFDGGSKTVIGPLVRDNSLVTGHAAMARYGEIIANIGYVGYLGELGTASPQADAIALYWKTPGNDAYPSGRRQTWTFFGCSASRQ